MIGLELLLFHQLTLLVMIQPGLLPLYPCLPAPSPLSPDTRPVKVVPSPGLHLDPPGPIWL